MSDALRMELKSTSVAGAAGQREPGFVQGMSDVPGPAEGIATLVNRSEPESERR